MRQNLPKVLVISFLVLASGGLFYLKEKKEDLLFPQEQNFQKVDKLPNSVQATSTLVSGSEKTLTPITAQKTTPEPKKKGSETATLPVSTTQSLAPAVILESKVVVAEKSTTTPVMIPSGQFPFEPIWRDALVNLVCSDRYSESLFVITSGSGVMIDPRGVILTNAHVAEHFLFANWPSPSLLNCSVRIGSPARPLYRAKLLYIPEGWISDGIANLYKTTDEDIVYGKKDYALLLVTGTTDPQGSLPEKFPYMPVSADPILAKGSFAYMIGYPAGYLDSVTIERDLYMLASPTIVEDVKSIGSATTLDVMSFKGIIAGQHGSSGGAVVQSGGKLIGLPTFFDHGYGFKTDENILNAITTGYISRDLKNDTGLSLAEFISQADLLSVSNKFMSEQGARYQKMFADAWKKYQNIVIPGVSY